jgi:hypothetical protein
MKMASRIKHSWQALAERLAPRLQDRGFVDVLREWLRHDLAAVSAQAAEALEQARGARLVLETDTAELPISYASLRAFAHALRDAELPRDPRAYVEFVDRLCWGLAVFVPDDDRGCQGCQGDVELWSDGLAVFEHCDLLGCCLDARGTPVTPTGLSRPARREEVLRHDPDARLLR